MATELERLDRLENDMINMKVRMGIAEGDIAVVKLTLQKIEHNLSQILWGVIGTFGTLVIGIILALVNHFLGGKP